MKAKNIMTKNVITVKKDETVKSVAKLLVENSISGVPVVDDENKIIGIVSEGDLIYQEKKIHGPSFVQILGGIIYLENMNRYEKELKKIIGYTVEEIMTKKVITVEEETLLEDISSIMVREKINRVPVTKNGYLVGIISRGDIMKAIAEI